MNHLKTLIVLATVLCLSIISQAETEKNAPTKGREAELNLSADQVKKIQEIKAKYAAQLKVLDSEACEKRVALHDAFKSAQKGSEFQKELEKKFTQLREAKGKDKELQFKMAIEIREILNTDQILKFNEIQGGSDKLTLLQCSHGSATK